MTGEKTIKCLGKDFASEEERREYFREELRKKLPELKKIEGFPIGEDEDIIALSDPPYYTACPNPWLNDFIEEWEAEKNKISARSLKFIIEQPYASDVSEGKNNPIYNAHSYHTKVPHPAIMRYILHYTQPGDIILDGFAGTGMTGVASQMCGKPDPELEYRINIEWKNLFNKIPQWGTRNAICGDLAPVASFISYNFNTPVDLEEFEIETKRILNETENELGWMYETHHSNGEKGIINFVVWSDLIICPDCGQEIIFAEVAVDKDSKKVKDEFHCNHCNAIHNKKSVTKAIKTVYDSVIGKTITQTKSIPVLISYYYNGKKYEKEPDSYDLELINKINEMEIPYWYPTNEIPTGDKTGEPLREGITHLHHFYTKRNLWILSMLYENVYSPEFLMVINSIVQTLTSKLVRYNLGNRGNGPLNGTLYVSSLTAESNVITKIETKMKALIKAFQATRKGVNYVSSLTQLNLKESCVDYIFTDPPFGSNIMYSELNYIWESWLKVLTNNKLEAIENKTQGKSKLDYQEIMTNCFKQYFRVLKPGKWMTVEFSNTSAAVWNGIQIALQRAGFIIANVSALDKKQGSFNAVSNPTSVKQDLVISCYKPSKLFEETFHVQSFEDSLWDFVGEHLQHLPITIKNREKTTAIIERSAKILYDRLITFYLMKGLPIPIDAIDFQIGLKQKFVERDGMYFTTEQVAKYDEEIAVKDSLGQLSFVFDLIYSEEDAIQWLKERLSKTQQKYQDIMPEFRKANVATRKGEREIELKTVLEENFIQESGGTWRVPNLNEAKDREYLKNKALLKEFDRYIDEIRKPKIKRLKEVRIEAIRAGFSECWKKKDFKTILFLGEKIPQNLLLEDEQLLMYYDIAKDHI